MTSIAPKLAFSIQHSVFSLTRLCLFETGSSEVKKEVKTHLTTNS